MTNGGQLTEYLGGEYEGVKKIKSTSGWSGWDDEDGENCIYYLNKQIDIIS
jgi:hypothetical protein